jgi:hypothetical protein
VWRVTARTFISRSKEKAFAGGELSSTFILLLHFLGSCDVNAYSFPTSKSLSSWEFSAAIVWFVVYTCFLLFSCWGVPMAACHTFNWFKDNVGQQCWPQLGETTNSCPGNSYSYIGWIPSLEWFNFILPGWSTTLAGPVWSSVQMLREDWPVDGSLHQCCRDKFIHHGEWNGNTCCVPLKDERENKSSEARV